MSLIQGKVRQSAMKQGILALGLFSGISIAAAQEAPRSFVASPDIYRVVAGNEQLRLVLVLVSWGPGQRDKPHSHPPYVAYLLTDCSLRFTTADGQSTDVQGSAGSPFSTRDAIVSHTVENIGKSECRLIMVEPK